MPSCGKTLSFWSQRQERVDELYFLMKFQIASVRNNETFDVGISERLKLKDIKACSDYIRSDSHVATQVWVIIFIMWSLLICLLLQIMLYVVSIYVFFWPKSHQCSSMRNVGCQTNTTISQSLVFVCVCEFLPLLRMLYRLTLSFMYDLHCVCLIYWFFYWPNKS